jgi:hypothetical protein
MFDADLNSLDGFRGHCEKVFLADEIGLWLPQSID